MNDDTLLHTQFDGVSDYIAALDTVCTSAQYTLSIFENDYADIGFNSERRYEILRRFLLASKNNRLNLLAHNPQPLIRYCPRMMILLREFGHGMFIFQTPKNLQHISETFAVADNTHYVRRYHYDHTRGILAKNDPEGARLLNLRFHEMWEESHSCASGTQLGL
jgi:hypothetical protein